MNQPIGEKRNLFFFLLFVAVLLLGSTRAQAQMGKIDIEVDPAISALIHRHVESNVSIRKVDGFRVQIKSSSDRDEVMKTKADLLKSYPNIKTYLSYQQPYFKLRIGDFTSQAEAYKAMKEVNDQFKGIFVVPDQVFVLPEGMTAEDVKAFKDDKK